MSWLTHLNLTQADIMLETFQLSSRDEQHRTVYLLRSQVALGIDRVVQEFEFHGLFGVWGYFDAR